MALRHPELDPAAAPVGDHRCGYDVGRVSVLEVYRLGLLLADELVGLHHGGVELRGRAHRVLAVEVGDEARVHLRAVLVGYVAIGGYVAHVQVAPAEKRERGREDEERDAALQVESDYLDFERERRVVHHDAPLGVFLVLEVPARVERAHELRAVEAVLACRPVGHGVVHHVWRVAVVGRLLRLEFPRERVVLVVALLGLRAVALAALEPVVGYLHVEAKRRHIKAERRHVEVGPKAVKLPEQQVHVPCGKLSDLVVGQPVRLHLRGRQLLGDHDGHRLHAEALRGLEPRVPDD